MPLKIAPLPFFFTRGLPKRGGNTFCPLTMRFALILSRKKIHRWTDIFQHDASVLKNFTVSWAFFNKCTALKKFYIKSLKDGLPKKFLQSLCTNTKPDQQTTSLPAPAALKARVNRNQVTTFLAIYFCDAWWDFFNNHHRCHLTMSTTRI